MGRKVGPPLRKSQTIAAWLTRRKGYGFGVLAAGTSYCILQHDESKLHCRIEPLPNLISGLQQYGPKPLDLMQNYPRVIAILQSIEDWIRVNVS